MEIILEPFLIDLMEQSTWNARDASALLGGYDPGSVEFVEFLNAVRRQTSLKGDELKLKGIYQILEREVKSITKDGKESTLLIHEKLVLSKKQGQKEVLNPEFIGWNKEFIYTKGDPDYKADDWYRKNPIFNTYVAEFYPENVVAWGKSKGIADKIFDEISDETAIEGGNEEAVQQLIDDFQKRTKNNELVKELKRKYFHAAISLGILLERERLDNGRVNRFIGKKVKDLLGERQKNEKTIPHDLRADEMDLVFESVPAGYRYPPDKKDHKNKEGIDHDDFNRTKDKE